MDQLQILLWSMARKNHIHPDLNLALKQSLMKNVNFLNERGLAFAYESLQKLSLLDDEVLKVFNPKCLELLGSMHVHYKFKILKNMKHRDQEFEQALVSSLNHDCS
jgi:hypothetical protein